MKKAQTEIIGLLVIVVLFVVLIAIFIALSGNRNNNDEFTQSTKVSNILTIIMQYTPKQCVEENFDIQEIIKICTDDEITLCGNIKCKNLIENEVSNILRITTKKDTYQLTFEHNIQASPLNSLTIGNCQGPLKIGDSYTTRDFRAKLLLCR